MSLTTNSVPVSLPSLSKLTESFSSSIFPISLADEIRKSETLPGLPALRFENDGYEKNIVTIYRQSYHKNSDKSISHVASDPIDPNQHVRYQHERSLSPPVDVTRRASAPTLQKNDVSASDRILLEKRKRNANASARFRDRRKQRERELQEKYQALEEKNKQFEKALKQLDPNHPLIADQNPTSTVIPSNNALFQRVDQLENMMQQFHYEKETSSQRLKELEDENKYLKSLIAPIGHHS